MRNIEQSPHLCSVDPVTLTGLALGAAGGLATSMMGGGGGSAAPTPSVPAPAPAQQAPAAKAPPKQQQPTFLGAAATPAPTQSGSKSLLGQ